MTELFLAGDIGGTKTNLGLFSARDGALQLESEAQFRTTGHASLDAILDEFLKSDRPIAASFGVAGPVRDNFADSTNFPWDVDGHQISRHLAGIPVTVINDMVAMAWGALSLPADRFVELNAGKPDPTGNAALIAAGTGLGQALMTRNGSSWIPVPTEGGHTSFAPVSPLQDELLEWLRLDPAGHSDDGHVSFERVVCGPGLVNIYRFLRDTGRGEEFDWMVSRMEAEDPAYVISDLALEKRSPLCEAAQELFVSIYGSEAGNLALKGLASGGVFIGGGIAPKILPAMQDGTFMKAFLNKGRMRKLVETMPVKIMIEPKAPLFGAAYCALNCMAAR